MKNIYNIGKLFEKLGDAYDDFCQRIGSVVSPF
ncbi:Uncharacterised protein [Yersinia massiliensis]|uniref:Uncharacterized protein n=1 Tax=Yersinia intermedia TaxID=631 RepID=A0A0H5LS08_YERIN|nr:Uncharacterised protein [Yersinia massiliensis]CRY53865.1 Uncharacterised protein [Yersinia intermedia]